MTSAADPGDSTQSPSVLPLRRLALVVNAGLAATWVLFWLSPAVQGELWRADFGMLYTGWRMVLEGEGERLYDLALQEEYQHRLIPQRAEEGGLLPFNYPPHAAVPAALLAGLSRPAAYYAWSALQLVLLARIAYSLVRLGHEAVDPPLLVVTLLAFPPLFFTIQLGQVALLLLLCQVEFVRGLSQGRSLSPALWLVLGSIKPQLMLAPAVVVLAGRRWRILAFACLSFGLWAVLATAVLGWACWPHWLELVAYSARQTGRFGIFPLAMFNLKGVLAGLFGEDKISLINAVSAAALLLGLAWAAWLWRRGDSAPAGRLALSFWLLLLLNPHVNPADVVTLALPAVLFLVHLAPSPPGPLSHAGERERQTAYLAFAALAVAAPLLFALDFQTRIPWPGNLSPFRLTMFAVVVWMALAVKRPSPDAGPEPVTPRTR